MKKRTKNLTRNLLILMLLSNGLFSMAQSGWEMVWSENSELGTVKRMSFVPGTDGLWETGYAGLFDGRILKTADGGDTWTVSATIPEYIWGISFTDENTGYAAGQAGSIFKTTDGGVSWVSVYFNTGDAFNKVAFKDANNGVATGYPNSIYTSDGGATWDAVAGNDDNYWSLDYAASDTYYGVEAFTGEVGQSTDNGQTWNEIYNTGSDLTICVDFLDANNGIVGCGGGLVKVTTDGATTWQSHDISDVEILAVGWFDADTVWASGDGVFKSTDKGETWIQDTTIFSSGLYNRELTVTGMNAVFVAGANIGTGDKQIWRKVGPPPVGAGFEADNVDVCAGSSVNFTDLSYGVIDSWYWEFEGGSPATSTDQNPTVTYSSPGIYDVKQVVTVGAFQDSLILTDYINVVELPIQAETPSGATEICTDQFAAYITDEVQYAAEYEWEISPTEAGTLSWDMNEASLTTAEDWTGDFTLKVRAVNVCGYGDWSDELEGTIYQSPEEFILQGGGGYCEGEDGVEITLNGSQTGVYYELYFDGAGTGQIISGNGDELSFGNQTAAGIYEALAFNTNCSLFMSNQIEVVVYELLVPVIDGLDMVCDWSEETYEVTETDGSVYTWDVTGGEITEGQGTYMITVSWNGEGNGTVAVEEETTEGCTASAEQFDVVIDDCTAIDENMAGKLNVYPNPASEFLNVSFISVEKKETRLNVYNTAGQLVITKIIQNSDRVQIQQINISNLNKGIYLLEINSAGDRIATKRFIKN